MSLHRVFPAFVLMTLGACAVHEAEPVFRATVLLGDRGISIPLPPPSLLQEPKQDVDVEGEVEGIEAADDLVVHVADDVGGAELEVALGAEATFRVEGLPLDLTDHCLDLWLEDGEGQQSEHQQYRAVIGDDEQTLMVVEGCD